MINNIKLRTAAILIYNFIGVNEEAPFSKVGFLMHSCLFHISIHQPYEGDISSIRRYGSPLPSAEDSGDESPLGKLPLHQGHDSAEPLSHRSTAALYRPCCGA